MNVDVFCSCRMPATYGDMVQCGLCEQWFHIKCVGLHSLPSSAEECSVHKSWCVNELYLY